jgi:ribosome biogenesis GTPase A
MMPLLVSSQTLSTEDLVTVPAKTLKNALIVKNERDYLKNQITVVRDSVNILVTITNNQDSIIKNQDTSISLCKKIDIDRQKQLEYKDNIITDKDNIITDYQNQIKKFKLKFIVSSIAFVGILLVI